MANGLVEGIDKLVKVFLVEVNLGFDKAAVVKATAFAFGDGDIKILVARGLYIKEIGTLTCSNPFGKDVVLVVRVSLIFLVHGNGFRWIFKWWLRQICENILEEQ